MDSRSLVTSSIAPLPVSRLPAGPQVPGAGVAAQLAGDVVRVQQRAGHEPQPLKLGERRDFPAPFGPPRMVNRMDPAGDVHLVRARLKRRESHRI